MDDDETVRAQRARKASPFLDTKQAAHYLGLTPKTLRNMRWDGVGPAFRKHGRFVRYHIDDLDRWSQDSGRKYDA
ncbi:putative DNA-binding transcriptional regulator AlpA [Sphingomonas sp. SORGH_AS 950]|uniref:helix-turn-helix domain-containing protein n=1 Tax=Sphingomonas sp. SORGH_AS_0950 TaxID=3041792 RepID=UPI00277F79BC|nr:helix-turn-helix domain-containing protein [Sphingomonas sp. SORGH_AS_0950]MDQ1158916.1 putative DNA-binding transcriptional regulator AlpA [Sphingomonas sp. SORGH_AS_0950]